jgi:hypothetical protein
MNDGPEVTLRIERKHKMKVRVKLTYFELSPATANPPIE